jgi:hypothetical protein
MHAHTGVLTVNTADTADMVLLRCMHAHNCSYVEDVVCASALLEAHMLCVCVASTVVTGVIVAADAVLMCCG